MEQQTQSVKFKRQRKFFMVVPALILPFITLLFWALGGGKSEDASAQTQIQQGFNMRLPEAYLKEDKPLDKMSYYAKASSDSARLKQLIKNDPYYKVDPIVTNDKTSSALKLTFRKNNNSNTSTLSRIQPVYQDSNEVKIYRKLKQLNESLDQNTTTTHKSQAEEHIAKSVSSDPSVNSADIDRLEKMMTVISQPGEEDEETKRLNEMLEKILDIQHPERVEEKSKQATHEKKEQTYAVISAPANDPVSRLINDSTGLFKIDQISNQFYSIDEEQMSIAAPNAIQAVVHETQTVVTGASLKLRLLQDAYINGVLIPKDNFVWGKASLNGERLNISITSIQYESSVFPVQLSAFDLDGMAGIQVPGAISRDVAKQSANNAIQNVGLNTFNPSLEIQAASAGIEAAKNLLSKKVKLINVTIPDGYQVLLQDERNQQSF